MFRVNSLFSTILHRFDGNNQLFLPGQREIMYILLLGSGQHSELLGVGHPGCGFQHCRTWRWHSCSSSVGHLLLADFVAHYRLSGFPLSSAVELLSDTSGTQCSVTPRNGLMLWILCPAGLHTTLTRFMQIFLTYLFSRAILNSAV